MCIFKHNADLPLQISYRLNQKYEHQQEEHEFKQVLDFSALTHPRLQVLLQVACRAFPQALER